MKPFDHPERGSSSIIAVLLTSFVLFTFLYANWSRTNSKGREIALRTAKSNAEQSNVAALSYFQASLHHDQGAEAVLRVEDEKIVGAGNSLIKSKDGQAIFERPTLAYAAPNEVAQKLSTGKSKNGPASKERTQLEILESQRVGHDWIYVVKATSEAKHLGKTLAKITTLGRISVIPQQSDSTGVSTSLTCGDCFRKAGILTRKLGFKASFKRTYNLGHYKVEKSTNLCDVHFMKNLSDTIQDHDGTTSLLGNQVAMYCPCECKWANNPEI